MNFKIKKIFKEINANIELRQNYSEIEYKEQY